MVELAHSSLGASSMYRWSICAASVRASKGIEQKSSPYAQEGTNAHALAAHCLINNKDPNSFVGHTLNLEGTPFEVSDNMAEAVAVYVDHINDTRQGGDIDHIEHRFDLSKVYPGCFGTADHVRWREKDSLLIVSDYKHGAGIFVSPVENAQLKYYALGALMTCGYSAKRVRMEIIQPRCDSADGAVRPWEIDSIELLDFAHELIGYAKATEDPAAPYVSGEHCRFCPAAYRCGALRSRSTEVAKTVFSAVETGNSYDPKALASALDAIPAVEAWIKATREFAYSEAEEGRCPPGYKIIPKRATRKWVDEDSVVAEAKKLGFAKAKIYDAPKLKSPAQMEKIVGKGKLDALMSKESSGHNLVPVSHPGEPVTLVTAGAVFEPILLPAPSDRRAESYEKTIFD